MVREDHGQSLVGRHIGVYKILSLIGAGGMGEVYRARDTKLGRDVAIKILPTSFALDRDRVGRFEREARLLAALNHPHIAAIYGFEESGPSTGSGQAGVRALVLELVEGPTLAERIGRGPVPVAEALTIARQIAEALQAAHEKGIIHRDLKPANIILQGARGPTPTRWKTAASSVDSPPRVSGDINVKVLDFGVAKAFATDEASPDLSQVPTVTATDMHAGAILGTPAYMSPEQARGAAIDIRSDLFSLGLVLYEMTTGRLPIPGASLGQVLAERAATPIEPPSRIREGGSLALDRTILRLLDADPGRRFQTAGTFRWSSFSVPVAGGSPTLFMPNAAGLRWIAPGQVMFSEIREGIHMGVVTAGESRAQARDVYVPVSPLGMAHFSERSPDGKWVLIVEMGVNSSWLPCRVVPFDGSSRGTPVGPPGSECRSATWSPDGRWMYFSAVVNNESHLWRQRFPGGSPEQLTSSTNQERGVVVDPDGRSAITSVGAAQSEVWYHDESGDRSVSVEGYAYRPLVSPDGSKVFYLVRQAVKRSFSIGELWAAELATGRNERVLPEFLVRSYHVSRDGKFVVFDAFDEKDRSRVWLAPTDRSQAPRQLTLDGSVEEQRPFFGASGDIYFMQEQEQDRQFIYRMKPDGSDRQKLSGPITFLVNISGDEKWAVSWEPATGGDRVRLLPLAGGAPRDLCACGAGPIFLDSPRVSWSGDGNTMFISQGDPASPGGGTVSIPWRGADTVPAGVVLSPLDLRKLPSSRYIRESSIAPGLIATRYAFTRQAEQSNLYRVRLP